MALHVLAYNMKRVISILGVGGLIEAIRAQDRLSAANPNLRVFTQAGSFASLWLRADHFRFAPNSGHGAAPQ
jgi:hypothetical protein